jgi:hypothetical protein
MILIAGPYRSGTNDDQALIQKNVEKMESSALPIFRAGHTPLLGEWLALPLVKLAGSKRIGDEAFNEIFHPIAVRLLEKCDAVLRVGGASAGADEMVRVGRPPFRWLARCSIDCLTPRRTFRHRPKSRYGSQVTACLSFGRVTTLGDQRTLRASWIVFNVVRKHEPQTFPTPLEASS